MASITESVSYEAQGTVGVITIDNPPVNALSHHVRTGIVEAMAAAQADEAVTAIVLRCTGRTFIAGADITEFGQPPQGESLHDAIGAIESSAKPVVAALFGTTLGGGLETAMGAHFRVANASATFGLPEVKLGLLPGAGGTQRLPRVAGAEKALQMMLLGDPIGAEEALACGLIDEIVDDLDADAIAFAQRVVADGTAAVPIRDREDKILADRERPEIFQQATALVLRKARGFKAPEHILSCVDAAVNLPFDEGMKIERNLFLELINGPQSAAQRYYFFAERQAAKIPGIDKDTPRRTIAKVGVLGAGTMGGGIAMNFANVGIPVTIVERDQESLDRGLGVVRKNYERSAKRGSISPEVVETRMAAITGSTNKADFGDCDLVIEAVFEDMDLKKSIFAELDQICKPDAIMASNTSALDLNEIASVTSRPADVIGMHFFSPANVMRLLEVVRGDATSDTVIATVMDLSKTIKKIPVLVGVCYGFVGNRMLFQRRIEADRLVLEGATPAQVDDVIYDFGFPMGPFAMNDLAGLDIGWKEETSTSSSVKELMCESGRRGQKNGRGYYTYDPETRAKTPDPDVVVLIREFAAEQGVDQREISDEEILDRCLLPMVNEGAKILEEGIAIRPSDIDVVWINGYGWPLYTGGPMYWADQMGLDVVLDKIKGFQASLGGDHWAPAPLLERLVAEGSTFASLNS